MNLEATSLGRGGRAQAGPRPFPLLAAPASSAVPGRWRLWPGEQGPCHTRLVRRGHVVSAPRTKLCPPEFTRPMWWCLERDPFFGRKLGFDEVTQQGPEMAEVGESPPPRHHLAARKGVLEKPSRLTPRCQTPRPESRGLSCLDCGTLLWHVEPPTLGSSVLRLLPSASWISSWDNLGHQMPMVAGPPSAWGPERYVDQGPAPVIATPTGCSRLGPHEDRKGAPALPSPSGVRMCLHSSSRRLSRECWSRSLAWAHGRRSSAQPWLRRSHAQKIKTDDCLG